MRGVRPWEDIAKDMLVVRIGPELRMAVVAILSYLTCLLPPPPATPHDLMQHPCINVRLPSAGKW